MAVEFIETPLFHPALTGAPAGRTEQHQNKSHRNGEPAAGLARGFGPLANRVQVPNAAAGRKHQGAYGPVGNVRTKIEVFFCRNLNQVRFFELQRKPGKTYDPDEERGNITKRGDPTAGASTGARRGARIARTSRFAAARVGQKVTGLKHFKFDDFT